MWLNCRTICGRRELWDSDVHQAWICRLLTHLLTWKGGLKFTGAMILYGGVHKCSYSGILLFIFSGWLGWGSKPTSQPTESSKPAKPKVEKGTLLPARFDIFLYLLHDLKKKKWIPACPFDKQLSTFAWPGQLQLFQNDFFGRPVWKPIEMKSYLPG